MTRGRPAAAIDCGTNSIRLLVSDGIEVRERITRVTRLGAGVDGDGSLDPEAIERTLAVLAEYRAICERQGVELLRAVATSAARDALDREHFLDRAGEVLGARPDLLSGLEEGRLAFAGAVADLDPELGPFCVIDLGGGSTEFAFGHRSLESVCTVEMGSVRFTERYVTADPPTPEDLVACLSVAEAHLTDVKREMPEVVEAQTFVGVAGTVTTVAAVELGLVAHRPELLHRFELTRDAAEDVYRTLVTEPLEDRLHNPGLPPERAEVIVGGSTLLVAIMRNLGIDPLLVSEHDLLDGIVQELLAEG